MKFSSLCAATLLGVTSLLTFPAQARDDGRYANSPLKPWFESLHSEFGQCCTDADGAVITVPNKIGRTMVWKHYIDGHPRVRCFMPGSMT